MPSHKAALPCTTQSACPPCPCCRRPLLQAHTSIAAFDPLFTLLHASMDRLLAMWQLAHPHDWVSSGVAGGGTLAVPRGSKVR